jgi:hypothetical protein
LASRLSVEEREAETDPVTNGSRPASATATAARAARTRDSATRKSVLAARA